ncbi:MAG: ABC transporter permease [Treponema sp.]|jgi:oligopeptide transport system permease protein|nr:ABC transporter permease [Treponema sp.]
MTEPPLHGGISPENFRFISPAEVAALSGPVEGSGERESYIRNLVRRLRKNRGAMAGFFCIVIIVIMALIGPFLNDFRYDQQITGNESMAPRIQGLEKWGIFDGREKLHTSTGVRELNRYAQVENGGQYYYWFGSDTLGRDIFTRTWEGTRISLFIALIAVLVDVCIGILYGFSSAYFGGKVDIVMQRIIEIINGIPTLVIVTLLIMVLRPGILSVTLTIMLTGWIGMSRMARAQMLKLKNREYVLAARTLGAGGLRIIFQEILPNSFGQFLVMSMFSIPNAIFTEAFLAFIGIGIPVPLASLGSLISDAFRSLTSHPYMILAPVIVLALLMLSFNLLADGLRDALDPGIKDKA